MKITIEFDGVDSVGKITFSSIDDGARFLAWLRGDRCALILEDAGEQKIQCIKLVREITSLGLKESKDLVESTPKQVGGMMTAAEAERRRKQFVLLGAKVRCANAEAPTP